jgi:hypothetical protein
MNKRSARPHTAGKSGGPLSLSHAAKGSPLRDAEKAFAEKLKNTPGLAEAYIQASQREYDERVKRGLFSTGELQVVKAALAAFHAEMRDVILRQKLCGLAKELLASKTMARNPDVEMGLMMNRMKRFKEAQALWHQLPEKMRPPFKPLMGQVEFDLLVRMERFLEKTLGVEEARRMMGLKKGDKSFYQKRQEARRIQASRTRVMKRPK